MTDNVTVSRELLRQVLKAFEVATTPIAADRQEVLAAIAALRAALEQPGVEPVASDVRGDAMADLGYLNGLKAGWNFCVANDDEGYAAAVYARSDALRALKAAPQPAQQVAGPVAALRRVMSRLADLLDEDQFAEMENIVLGAGVAPQPAQQPDASAAAIQACIDRLIQGGKPAEAGMLRNHFGVGT